MAEPLLRNRRVLVAEDEYMLAEEMREGLEGDGAVVLGPAATVDQTLYLIAAEAEIDVAVLDVNLRGKTIYPAVDVLIERGVPLVLTTGYGQKNIPERFHHLPRCDKPVDMKLVARAVGRVLGR